MSVGKQTVQERRRERLRGPRNSQLVVYMVFGVYKCPVEVNTGLLNYNQNKHLSSQSALELTCGGNLVLHPEHKNIK
jgi:hypothetical protein